MEDQYADRLAARTQELMAESGLSWRRAWLQAEDELGGPPHDEVQSQGCLGQGLLFGFWFWIWAYGYVALVMLFAYATRPIFGDDLMNQNGILVAVPAMILMGVGVILGNRRWRTIPFSVLVALNIIGPASLVLLFLPS